MHVLNFLVLHMVQLYRSRGKPVPYAIVDMKIDLFFHVHFVQVLDSIISWCFIDNLLVFFVMNFQENSRRNNNWLPPPWAIAALVILGFNEFMTLLRYSIIIFYFVLSGRVGIKLEKAHILRFVAFIIFVFFIFFWCLTCE